MQQDERIQRIHKWKDKFYRTTIWIFVLVLIQEILMYFVLSALGLMEDTPEVYIRRYFIIPVILNGSLLLIQYWIKKAFSGREYLISVWPVFTIALMCGVIACIHCVFPATLSIFCVPICMTVVYEDEKLTKGMLAVSMICILVAGIFRGVSGFVPPEKNTYLIPDMVISMITVAVCFFVSLMLVRLLREKDEDLLQSKQEAEEAKQEAEEANSAKSLFLSNMSHEIRTPMNAIIGMTEVIMRNEHSPEEAGYLMNIKNSGDALVTIINDILDLSKIESGKMEIVEEDYEPMSMISDMGMIFWNRIGEKEIELLFDIDENLPVKLCGDSLRIRQVLVNLMNNAVKFTSEGRVKLEIRILEQKEDVLMLRYGISDTGQGIREEDMQKLFDKFQQVDVKKNHGKEGTGLGLSISRLLVSLMGGELLVSSEYGKGSEFYFVIPQKIVKPERAATLKEEGPELVVGGRLLSNFAGEQFERLTGQYDVRYAGEELQPDMDFFFTDDEAYLAQDFVKEMLEENVTVCFLQNPMHMMLHQDYVTTINKPLYSLNFCQTLNREASGGQVQVEEYINFTAPEAEVLLVDDNEMNRIVAVSLLKPLQMKMDLAEDGKQAVERIKNKHYDLVFMDHMMPVMDGVEATKLVRSMEGEYYHELPIIALTANAMADACRGFLEAGMNDFVAKPIDMKEICARIKHWLPDELIIKSTGTVPAVEKEDVEIPEIAGIDMVEGIKNSGSKELFLRLLGDFYRLIDMKSNKIEKCLADGMLKDYTIEVHALKSTARMIGAMELSERFYEMEKYGNEENTEALYRETPEVLTLYRSYKAILKPFSVNADSGKEEISAQDLVLKLKMLENAIQNFDMDTADDVMGELARVCVPEKCIEQMEHLTDFYADLAMSEMIETCKTMINCIEEK